MNNYNYKSATTAGLLGIFLGAFGAQDWYLGDKKKGTIHVALAGGGFLLLIIANAILPAVLPWRAIFTLAWLWSIMGLAAALMIGVSGVWGFIEGLMILTQGDAGLARKGYNVISQNGNNQNNMQNGGMQNFGGQQNNNQGQNQNRGGNYGQ